MNLSWATAARTRPVLLGIFALLTAAGAHQAHAHARVVRTQPPNQARLAAPPQQIELWFDELLDDGFNSVEVFPASELTRGTRTNRARGLPHLDAQDHTHVIVPVQSLPAGEYVVEWRVLSRDGHSAPGRVRFHVLGPR